MLHKYGDAKATLTAMHSDMQAKYGYLTSAISSGSLARSLGEARKVVSADDKQLLDSEIDYVMAAKISAEKMRASEHNDW